MTQLRDAAKESGDQSTSLDESRSAILEDHNLFVQDIAPSIELVRRATGMGDGSDVRQKLALDTTEKSQK